MKICKDCRHSRQAYYLFDYFGTAPTYQCFHPSKVEQDIVTGEISGKDCADMREMAVECSESATWFEPKKSRIRRFFERLVS